MSPRTGFIGLGQMGKWMARNLLSAGFEVGVFDLDDEAMTRLIGMGAYRIECPAGVWQRADCVLLCLPNPAAVEATVWGEQGLAAGWSTGNVVVDCGTSDVGWTQNFAAELKKKGIRFMDAPVSGMERLAKAGRLTIMCGGERSLFTNLKPMFAVMGETVVHLGPVGSGQLGKLINNLIFNANLCVLAETMPMAVKLGLDPASIARVINHGTGRSFASETFLPKVLQDQFDHGYALQKAYKDMVSGVTLAAEREIPLPVISASMGTYIEALNSGLGTEDKGALIKVFERLLAVSFRCR